MMKRKPTTKRNRGKNPKQTRTNNAKEISNISRDKDSNTNIADGLEEAINNNASVSNQIASSSELPSCSYLPVDISISTNNGDPDGQLSHEETYLTGRLKLFLHGTVYQWRLLELFSYRATDAYECFSLATEMIEAGYFDDVVLKYKISITDPKFTCRFLQCKHRNVKDGYTITESELFMASLSEKPFLLSKYYSSFIKIRQNEFFADSDLKDFIICTNNDLAKSAEKYFKKVYLNDEKILSFESSTFKVFKLSDEAKNNFPNSKNNKELNEFFKKFTLIVNFPNVDELNALISKDLGIKYGLLNAEFAANTFEHHIIEWFKSYKNKQSKYLYIENGKEFLQIINQQINTLMTAGLSVEYMEKIMSYNIHFRSIPEDIETFLIQDKTQILHLSSESALLTFIKVADTITNIEQFNKKDGCIYVPLEKLLIENLQALILNAFSSSKSHNLLIVNLETSETTSSENFFQFYLKVHKILPENLSKKIITISDSKNIYHPFMMGVDKSQTSSFQKRKCSSSYKDLNDTTQEEILQKEIIFQEKRVSFNEIINTFSAHNVFNEVFLTEFIKNTDIHIGSNKIESSELKVLSSYVPRTLSPEISQTFSGNSPNENSNAINEYDLVHSEEPNENIYYILTGEPGMGKSAFTVKLKQTLKQIYPLYWVVRINLSDYCNKSNGEKSLDDIKFSELEINEIIDFMAEIVIPDNSSNTYVIFQRKLFRLALQNCNKKYKYPKIAIIFDGFDEISPSYQKESLVLLKALKNTNVEQLWITTRTHEARTLKQELNWPIFHLNPFTNDQKMKYVTKFLTECNVSNINTILNSIYTWLSEMNSELNSRIFSHRHGKEGLNSDFANNPLHLRMILEIILKNKNYLKTTFTLYQLYSEFVETKFDIFYKDKSRGSNTDATSEICTRDRTNLRRIHQQLALKEVFPKLSKKENLEMNTSELVRPGFIIISGARIKFVHRSFAEFFFSDYLDENFKNPLVENFLTDMYFYNFHLSIVKKLLNNSDNFLKQLKNTDHNVYKTLYERNLHDLAICTLIENNNDNILRSLLFNAKANNTNLLETILDRCFQHKETLRGTKSQMVSLIQLTLLDTGSLFDVLIDDIINPKTKKEFLIRDKSCFYIWAIYYSGTDRRKVLNDLFEAALKNEKSKNKDKSFQDLISEVLNRTYDREASILHEIASEMRVEFIEVLILWLKDNNQNIIVKLLFMMDSDNNSFLQVLKCRNSLTSFLSFLFETLGKDEFQKLIGHTTKYDKTIFHHYIMRTIIGYEAMNSYLNFLTDNFTKEVIAGIIYQVDNLGCTAFHYAFEDPDDYMQFRLLLQFAISSFEPNKYLSFNQASHDAYEDMALKDLVECCKATVNQDFFDNFSRVDKSGQTILHNMVERLTSNTNKVFDGFLNFLTDYFGVENVLTLFFFKTDKIFEQNVLHVASRRHNETLQTLLDYTKEKFNLESVIALVLQPDLYGRTCLHNAAQSNSDKSIRILLEFALANFPVDVTKKMLLAVNNQKQNILHLAANNYFSNISDPLLALLKFFIKSCDISTIFRKLFLQTDDHNKTFLDIIKYRMKNYLLEIKRIYGKFIETLDINNLTHLGVQHTNIITESESTLLHKHIKYLFWGPDYKEGQNYISKLDKYLKKFTVYINESR